MTATFTNVSSIQFCGIVKAGEENFFRDIIILDKDGKEHRIALISSNASNLVFEV